MAMLNISQIISKHIHWISTSELKEIFPNKSIITAYRRPKKGYIVFNIRAGGLYQI